MGKKDPFSGFYISGFHCPTNQLVDLALLQSLKSEMRFFFRIYYGLASCVKSIVLQHLTYRNCSMISLHLINVCGSSHLL